MKIISIVICLALLVLNLLHAQEQATPKDIIRSTIVIKITPIPFLFETVVGGRLEIDQQNLSFIPSPCSEKDKKNSAIFPCNNHLISRVDLNFSAMIKISRRSYLLFQIEFLLKNQLERRTYS